MIIIALSVLILGWSGLGLEFLHSSYPKEATISSGDGSVPIPENIAYTATPKFIQQSEVQVPTSTPTNTNFPIFTATSTVTETPYPTDTPSPSETPTFEWHAAGSLTSPILLYHHVSDVDPENRYYVTLENFQNQMESLHAWGYSTITASDLAHLIVNGGEVPNRPVVITFDDGFADVYVNAFPMMQEMNFVGTIYIYVDHIGSRGYLDAEQISVLAQNGWEIGNHGMSHADLTQNYSNLYYEVEQSRATLEQEIGVDVTTFSYPYGVVDDYVIRYIRNSGYLAGMGLGLNYSHSIDNLYLLTRIEIQSNYDISKFTSLLPWTDN